MIFTLLAGIIKLPVSFFVLFLFFISGNIGKLFFYNRDQKLKFNSKNTRFWNRILVKLLSIKIKLFLEKEKNLKHLFNHQNYLIVSNHLSYLDIFILSSIHPFIFITSVEMHETFFLGNITELGGSFFVERRNPSRLHEEITKISEILKKGFNIVLFPEGTSTNGEKVYPFKKSLLACAVESHSKILPVCIKYKSINGKPINLNNRDLIYWYGNMTFFSHYIHFVLKTLFLKVEIHFLPILQADYYLTESAARKKLTDEAFSLIEKEYLN